MKIDMNKVVSLHNTLDECYYPSVISIQYNKKHHEPYIDLSIQFKDGSYTLGIDNDNSFDNALKVVKNLAEDISYKEDFIKLINDNIPF